MSPSLNGNWVDLVIILILIYYASVAFRYGFWGIMMDFVSFFGSLLISLRAYKFTSVFLKSSFNLPDVYNNAVSFIATAILAEISLSYLLAFLVGQLPDKVKNNKYNVILGLIPALGEGIIMIAFLLTTVIALPVNPQIKHDVTQSKIGSYVLKQTSGLEKVINQIFGGAVNDALTYFTIEPDSKSTINLKGGIDHLSVDDASEKQMLVDVNHERTSRGLSVLESDSKMVKVARDYATDMWTRQYFSHYNPEGKTVADRFKAAGISFDFAGENLALAPTESTAMTGLMNSPGHKANILDTNFHKIGIGVIDNGIYGKIFVQEFSN